ncbi:MULTISPECIES: hypothetical protein [Asticcacaulis]|jgi:hypothetical protein|uniref:Gene transfer agent associated protein n=1 Tax=Asticcacaulis excentricus TaxID=78587 RepID=A0A3G9G915_9CAUL|nr:MULTISPECIES: hypothetical protein [Asticcacaulis]MCA1935185.1 hypothetical protein [Asticcacaulis sp.]BBF80828.1 gene transfer agent associated protein [Asticcacaulis excentricus]
MTDIFTGGVIVTIVLQSAAALMWFGRASARLDTLEARLQQQAGVVERLARLEEQALATRAALSRIEAKLDQERG